MFGASFDPFGSLRFHEDRIFQKDRGDSGWCTVLYCTLLYEHLCPLLYSLDPAYGNDAITVFSNDTPPKLLPVLPFFYSCSYSSTPQPIKAFPYPFPFLFFQPSKPMNPYESNPELSSFHSHVQTLYGLIHNELAARSRSRFIQI